MYGPQIPFDFLILCPIFGLFGVLASFVTTKIQEHLSRELPDLYLENLKRYRDPLRVIVAKIYTDRFEYSLYLVSFLVMGLGTGGWILEQSLYSFLLLAGGVFIFSMGLFFQRVLDPKREDDEFIPLREVLFIAMFLLLLEGVMNTIPPEYRDIGILFGGFALSHQLSDRVKTAGITISALSFLSRFTGSTVWFFSGVVFLYCRAKSRSVH